MPRFWTRRLRHNAKRHLDVLHNDGNSPIVMLEIGVYQSETARWLCENYLTHDDSRYYGIDIWDLHFYNRKKFPRDERGEAKVQCMIETALNLESQFRPQVKMIQGKSWKMIPKLHFRPKSINFAYIDGEHTAEAAYRESWLVWPLIAENGVIVWDDYVNKPHMDAKRGIDKFLSELHHDFHVLFINRQIGVLKL